MYNCKKKIHFIHIIIGILMCVKDYISVEILQTNLTDSQSTPPSALMRADESTASSTNPRSLSMLSIQRFFIKSKCSWAAWLVGSWNTILAAVVTWGVRSSTYMNGSQSKGNAANNRYQRELELFQWHYWMSMQSHHKHQPVILSTCLGREGRGVTELQRAVLPCIIIYRNLSMGLIWGQHTE